MKLPSELQAALDEARRHVAQRDITGAEDALKRLEASRKAFAEECLAEYAREHQAAVSTLLPVLRRGFILEAVLAIPLPGLHHTRIADLRDPSKIVFDVNDLRRIVQSGGWERALGSGGVDDPEGAVLYRELGPIREAIEKLEKLTGKRTESSAPSEQFNSGAYSHWAITGGCAVTRL
jgi:hypothetical protein